MTAEHMLVVALAAFETLPSEDYLERYIALRSIRMSPKAFRSLPEYSSSVPTGAYPGKMWRANVCVPLWHGRRIHVRCCELWVVRSYQPVDTSPTGKLRIVEWRYDGERETQGKECDGTQLP